MTVNGVDGGNSPLNGQKPTEPRIIKDNVEKGSIFKEQMKNDQGQLVREITYWDRNKDGQISSDELYGVAQYIYEENGTTVNQLYDRNNDGMADAKFKTYKYDKCGNLQSSNEDEYEGYEQMPLEGFIEHKKPEKPQEPVQPEIKPSQPTQPEPPQPVVSPQGDEEVELTVVKEGIEKGAVYKEQINEEGKLVAEFMYKDYNNDGTIDTSEMISAAFYDYGADGVHVAQYVDLDKDEKTDGEVRLFKYDKTGKQIEHTVEKDDKYKGVKMHSLRDSFIDPLDEIIDEIIEEDNK